MPPKRKNPPPSDDATAPAHNTRGAKFARAQADEPDNSDDFIPLLSQAAYVEEAVVYGPQTPEEAQRAVCGVYPTPLVYLKGEMPRKRATRARAVRDAIYHDFCEITHHPNTCSAVQGCHCVPRSWMGPKSEKRVSSSVPYVRLCLIPWQMRAIEYSLGFRYAKSFNLDTRINIFLRMLSKVALPTKLIR